MLPHQVRLEAELAAEIRTLAIAVWHLQNVDLEVFDTGMDFFANVADFAAWLASPQSALGNQLPLLILTEPEGREKVLNTLRGLSDGGYL